MPLGPLEPVRIVPQPLNNLLVFHLINQLICGLLVRRIENKYRIIADPPISGRGGLTLFPKFLDLGNYTTVVITSELGRGELNDHELRRTIVGHHRFRSAFKAHGVQNSLVTHQAFQWLRTDDIDGPGTRILPVRKVLEKHGHSAPVVVDAISKQTSENNSAIRTPGFRVCLRNSDERRALEKSDTSRRLHTDRPNPDRAELTHGFSLLHHFRYQAKKRVGVRIAGKFYDLNG